MNKSLPVAARVSLLKALSSLALIWFTALSLALSLATSSATAHEVFPAIADMTETDGRIVFQVEANLESFVAGVNLTETPDTDLAPQAETYDMLRSLAPADLEDRFRAFWPEMAGMITLSADGTPLTPSLDAVTVEPVGDIDIVRNSQITFSAALPAGASTVQMGWDSAFGVLVLRQMGVDAPYDGYLQAGSISPPIRLAGGDQASAWDSFFSYIPVGFDHIVPKGLDHILFVLGLFFLAARVRPLLLQVSLFTVAHTITLALAATGHTDFLDDFFMATFGIAFIAVVEPLIALSIVYVAIENIFTKGISPWRPFVIFIFGLLHGLGFASVLAEFGLPENTFVPALIGFNIGVELGQLAVIAVMFVCIWQALRIDRGKNEIGQGMAIYAVLITAGLALIALDPAGLADTLEAPVWLFAAPLVAIFVLCIASIHFRDRLDAFRNIVAVPASVAIAVVGAYWFAERTVM